jgi:hypothetical protein
MAHTPLLAVARRRVSPYRSWIERNTTYAPLFSRNLTRGTHLLVEQERDTGGNPRFLRTREEAACGGRLPGDHRCAADLS